MFEFKICQIIPDPCVGELLYYCRRVVAVVETIVVNDKSSYNEKCL